METLHTTIGVLGVLAFLVLITHSASQVVVHTSRPLVGMVDRGTNVMDRLTPGDGMLPILDCERMFGICAFVRNMASRLYALVEIFASSDSQSTNQAPNQSGETKAEDPKTEKRNSGKAN